jgi:hypothetical protein
VRKVLTLIASEFRGTDGNLPAIQDCISFVLFLVLVSVVAISLPDDPTREQSLPASAMAQSTQP